MTSRARRVAIGLTAAAILFITPSSRTQGEGPRRLTRTAQEFTNINPTISGDGARVAFESNAGLSAPHDARAFRLFTAALANAPSFEELAASRGPAPAASQDGSRVAFAAREDPLGTNGDGDSEIFLHESVTLPIPLPLRHAYASNMKRQGYVSSQL